MNNGFIMLDLEGQHASQDELELMANPKVCGVILFARNYHSFEQLAQLTASLRRVRSELLIAVDQEGGRVQRFKDPFTRIPAMRVLGDCFKQSPIQALEAARSCGWLLASELLAAGVDFSFTPVLDIDTGNSSVIGDRAFGSDHQLVVSLASCLIDGLHEAGMPVVGKHFPGHGSVAADSHLELPVDRRNFKQLEQFDLIPFQRLAPKLDAIMPAYVLYNSVDAVPAGVSKIWLKDILRGQLGFDGLIISDDLSMEGIAGSGDYKTRGKLAIEAGCNILLACNNRAGALELLELERPQSGENDARMKRMLGNTSTNHSVDFKALKNSKRWKMASERIKGLEF
ncbi:MAG: beta-N-acetylhexosaminidase [Pseudomonadales bacterium]|nr:beta-N-acetylhexosaminidase [Pseudomonadales bacterium]